MASTFQQQSLQRKLIYFGLIVLLFTCTLVLRNSIIEPKAEALGLREQNLGETDLTGSFVRLTLTGLNGLVVTGLWWEAAEMQMRHEWNELEVVVNTLTKFQPHFITPWLFQSWNLAYNVSVESDRIKDKYFYVARGIQLLAEGERRNRDNPEIRLNIGFYYMSKIGISDENKTMRSLMQMSCIDPVDRNPALFRRTVDERTRVDLEQFEKFCKEHPHLVRRLREGLNKSTPEEIINFLEENQKIPNRFEERTLSGDAQQVRSKLNEDGSKRFPILPLVQPRYPFANEPTNNEPSFPDQFDNYGVARAWFGYAQDPLQLDPPIKPKQLMLVIFQGYPARAQAYVAERLEQEGWFDDDPWEIADWFPRDKANPEGAKRRVEMVGNTTIATDEWRKAHEMYRDHGRRNNLYKTPEEEAGMSTQERSEYDMNRHVTNYLHFLYTSEVEQRPETVKARKYFFKAERLRRSKGELAQPRQMYERPEAFGPPSTWDKSRCTGWKRILIEWEHFQQDKEIQQQTYETQFWYLTLVKGEKKLRTRDWLPWRAAAAQLGGLTPTGPLWLPGLYDIYQDPLGPFDDEVRPGVPFISPESERTARSRLPISPLDQPKKPPGPATSPGPRKGR